VPEKEHRWRAWLRARLRASLATLKSSRLRLVVLSIVLVVGAIAALVDLNGGVRSSLTRALNGGFGDSARADGISLPAPIPYSHSWYIDQPDALAQLGQRDAGWLNEQSVSGSTACPTEYVTVLDFGHPTRKFATNGSALDDYAMSMFGKIDSWRTYREVEQLAQTYIDSWVATASSCPRLILVLGTSNYAECAKAVATCDVYTAGKYWDLVVHYVADYVQEKGYGSRITGVWVGDDAETSWDPWPVTASFLYGVRDQERTYQTHARMVNYGDAVLGACSEVTGACSGAWTAENVYDAAWGIGWAAPMPEAYTSTSVQRWQGVADVMSSGAGTREFMQFLGLMTECGERDPLPLAGCRPQGAGLEGGGSCELSPAGAYQRLHAADARHPLTYATNIQWLQPQTDEPTGAHPCR
jgi:hypothetical protein